MDTDKNYQNERTTILNTIIYAVDEYGVVVTIKISSNNTLFFFP